MRLTKARIARIISEAIKDLQDPPDSALLHAIILTESAGDPWSVRYEPGFRWLVKEPDGVPGICTETTESRLQMFSFGLMQIMGAVAREQGFKGWLTELLEPKTNVKYGALFLLDLAKRYKGDDIIAAYNAGSPRFQVNGDYVNQGYVEKVKSKIAALKQ
jgi:hypothetical protein